MTVGAGLGAGADAGAESAAELLLSPRSKENWEKTSRAIRRASLFKIQQDRDDEQRARQALSKPIAPSKPARRSPHARATRSRSPAPTT